MSFPKVGVIGAGQLARMMVAPAIELGIDLTVFAGGPSDSAAQITNFVVGDYTDSKAVLEFAKNCDVLTFEHEQVPQSVIRTLEANGIRVYPRSDSFIYSQDKFAMREKMVELGLPNPRFEKYIGGATTLEFPLIAKAPSGGYDGRGVWVVNTPEELAALPLPLLLEEKLDFTREIAIMVARSPHGQAATWSPTWTIQRDGICTTTVTPIPELSEELAIAATSAALTIAQGINLVGVMAVELFLVGQTFIINELAMRPHNSGHWTIEGSKTSQFEQHLRAILDLPLGDTSRTSDWAVMGNILGGQKSDMYRPYLHLMARTPGLKFHHYRKEVKPGRKIGHVTLLGDGDNLVDLMQEVSHAVDYLSGVIDE